MEENIMTLSPVTLTEGAIEQLNEIRKSENIPADYALRVGVKGGGCSGMSYILGFDEIKADDEIFETNGIKVTMNKAHKLYLLGMEIDWVTGLENRGFTYNNPNAKESCGCGTSFSI